MQYDPQQRRGTPLTQAFWIALLVPVLAACGSDGDGASDESAGEGGSGAAVTNGTGGTRVLEWQGGSGGTAAGSSGLGRSGGASSASGGQPGGGGFGGAAPASGGTGPQNGGAAPVGGAAGSTTACAPEDMANWGPPAYVSARAAENVCTEQEIQAFTSQCLLGGDCAAFAQDGPSGTCGACLAPSALEASAYGPVLVTVPPPASAYGSNTAGCIELMGEPDCARAIQVADACARAACEDRCAPAASFDFEAYYTCTAEARSGVCAEYQAATACVRDPAHASACSGSNFETIILAVGKVFCGAG